MAVAASSVGHGAATDTTQTACYPVEPRPVGPMPERVGRYQLCRGARSGLDGGDLLAVNHELGTHVAMVDPGGEPRP